MRSLPAVLAILTVAACLAVPARVCAEERPLEFEAGRTASQFAVGVLVAGGSLFALTNTMTDVLVVAAVPAAVGGLTCMIGRSGHHEGSCGATILGAYLGTAMLVPLGYLGYLSDRDQRQAGQDLYYGNATIGVAIGWLLLQPLGATLGWYFSRSPRQVVRLEPPPLRPAPRLLAVDPGSRRRQPFAPPPALLAPVLSLRF